MHMWDYGGSWPLMMLAMVLFWVAIIALTVLLVRNLMTRSMVSPTGTATMETPRSILDRRLAAGEISPEEYDRVRQKLNDQQSQSSGGGI